MNYFAILDQLGDKFVSQFLVTKEIIIRTPISLWKDSIEKVVIQNHDANELRQVWVDFSCMDDVKCCLEYYKLDEILCKLYYNNQIYTKQCESIEQVYQFVNSFRENQILENIKMARDYLTQLLKVKNATNIRYQKQCNIHVISFDFPRQVFNIFESNSPRRFFGGYDPEFKITSNFSTVFIHYFSSHQAFSGRPDDYAGIKSTFTLFQGFDSESYNFWVLVALRCNFLQYCGITSVNGKRFLLEHDHQKFYIYITWTKEYSFELKMSIDSKYSYTLDEEIPNPTWNDLTHAQILKVGHILLLRDENYSSGSD